MADKPLDATIVDKPVAAKSSTWVRFKNAFIASTPKEVKRYIVKEIIVPGIIDITSGAAHGAIDMFLYGESRSSARPGKRSGGRGIFRVGETSYEEYYEKKNKQPTVKSASGYFLDDMIFKYQETANDVLDKLYDLMNTNGVVSVYEYLDACEISADSTDWNYGWKTMEGSVLQRDRDGWRLHMPKPIRIKD